MVLLLGLVIVLHLAPQEFISGRVSLGSQEPASGSQRLISLSYTSISVSALPGYNTHWSHESGSREKAVRSITGNIVEIE